MGSALPLAKALIRKSYKLPMLGYYSRPFQTICFLVEFLYNVNHIKILEVVYSIFKIIFYLFPT